METKRIIKINEDTRIRTNPNFVLREVGGENNLVPLGDAELFQNMTFIMNEPSVFMWKLFMEGATVAEARDKVLAEYISESDNNADILSAVKEYVVKYVLMGLLIPEEQGSKGY